MGFDLWADLLTVAGVAVGAGGLAWSSAVLLARIGRRRDSAVLSIDALCRRPWILTLTALGVELGTLYVDAASPALRRVTLIAVIAAACWLLRRLLLVAEHMLFRRLRMDVANNRRVRRARTQITVLRRTVVATVMMIGIAGGLMTFPDLRTFGGSLMASAGIAGIIAALAAQTMLGNVFAGIQLAFTDAVRIDDVVVVEEEWGWIEEITLTYVVVRIWDERRLVLPTSYFTTTPFQNWTRDQARLLGSITVHLDYNTPLESLREFTHAYLDQHPLWDREDWVLQVVDTTETTMMVRVLASSNDSQSSWDLRCDVREAMLTFLRESHPQALPVRRLMVPAASAPTPSASLPSASPVASITGSAAATAMAPKHVFAHDAEVPRGPDPDAPEPLAPEEGTTSGYRPTAHVPAEPVLAPPAVGAETDTLPTTRIRPPHATPPQATPPQATSPQATSPQATSPQATSGRVPFPPVAAAPRVRAAHVSEPPTAPVAIRTGPARSSPARHAGPPRRVVLPDATAEPDLNLPPPRRSAHVAR